ncbi:di-heme-cytochrome C peroxidase [Nitrosomonas oligotropha]|uniref:di-heme-cytochrome C peroxidase n=1 Tax=Nitrosomonas oligotropha TaxID=42354 RepID=UPI001370F01C|nr:di-heme-cytochrome C peroxidase [Nitrosomonas oligotropha]MXS82395.1 ribonuclease E [Nitrosomonas oligotropha]
MLKLILKSTWFYRLPKKLLFFFTACITFYESYNALKVAAIFFSILITPLWIQATLIPEPDMDSEINAAIVSQDSFGDNYTEIRYLNQNWQPEDSNWFYNTPIGSNLMPYDFFMVLEKEGGGELFRSNENMNFYRYLIRKASSGNPDGLPVGWVKSDYKGQKYIGLTCAACHTGQINYNGVGIRIDGGPSIADMENCIIGLAKALQYTSNNEETKKQFVKNVLARGHYKSETEVLGDLVKYEQQLINYITINRGPTPYGYARLDALGRTYNRVLEHLISENELRELVLDLKTMYDSNMGDEKFNKIMEEIPRISTGDQRDRMMEYFIHNQYLTKQQLDRMRKELFNPADAPVSYPFLWDTSQHNYVQWNGAMMNSNLGRIIFSTEKVIGVFGSLDWTKKNFNSSINIFNLRGLELHLQRLQSPQWPEKILGAIDKERALHGKNIFNEYCASCHDNTLPSMYRVSDIGTDPVTAENSFSHTGYSGILRNQYIGVGIGNILLGEKAPVAALLTKAALSAIATIDSDKNSFERRLDRSADFFRTLLGNAPYPSIKQGNYDPDTTAKPFASLNAYKARSLNGIWATAPYLHNGSIPTLYDLLLPKKREGDPEDGEYRPDQFEVGSREFDPIKVGLKSSGYEGFKFDTSLKGNSNAGHEYTTGKTAQLNGRILKPLTKEERLDLLEYLKTL